MRCLAVILIVGAALVGVPVGAAAASSTGLYEPFPSPVGGPRAQRYVGELGVRLRPADLGNGAFLGPLPPGADTAAAARAGTTGRGDQGSAWSGLAVAAVLLAGVMALALFKHPRRRDDHRGRGVS